MRWKREVLKKMTLNIEETLLNDFLHKQLPFQNRKRNFFAHAKKLFKLELPNFPRIDYLIKPEYEEILEEIDENMRKVENLNDEVNIFSYY